MPRSSTREPSTKSHDLRITCGHCDGEGSVPLPMHLAETLAIIRSKPSTVAEILRVRRSAGEPVGHTAINQRVEKLRQLGLAERRSFNGKLFVYEATT
jgi:hypothetical protein